jgi:hypothetical protein
MNIWRRSSLNKNPYARTAFRVARVSRETVRHRTLVQLIGRTKRIVNVDATAHIVGGKPITDAEINAAEAILLNPKQRIAEELLEHATEKLPLERIKKLAREAAEISAAQNAESLQETTTSGLQSWAQSLVRRFVSSVESPDPSFGAPEVGLIPPFGR